MTEHLCPLWGETPVTTLDENGVLFVYSPRAGGVYGLTGEWRRRGLSSPNADLIGVPEREKANLRHWIYRQNWTARLLWPLEGMSEWDREAAMDDLRMIDPKLLQLVDEPSAPAGIKVVVAPEVKRRLRIAAAKRDMTVSKLIREVCVEWLDANDE